MAEWDDLFNQAVLGPQGILERVDEYTLYCHYLGYQAKFRTRYTSPVRDKTNYDGSPSFSIYECRKKDVEFMWKDQATGESGDIFMLIKIMFQYRTLKEVYQKIDIDFKLGYGTKVAPKGEKIKIYIPDFSMPETKIRIQSREFTHQDKLFWLQFGITKPTLDMYRVKSVAKYWLNDFQQIANSPRGLCFSYNVLDKTKLYQPYVPFMKFRNDYTERCLEGFAQLQYHTDTLIITKSTKDVMLLREFGHDAVSPRSENTAVPKEFMQHFRQKYKKIFILFDNDGKHRGDWYPEPKIFVPINSGEKDISDFRKRYGHQLTKDLLNNLIK